MSFCWISPFRAHARREHPLRGVVDVLDGSDARLDQVIGFVQDRVLEAVDEKADDGLVEHHRLLAGAPERIGHAVHSARRGQKVPPSLRPPARCRPAMK